MTLLYENGEKIMYFYTNHVYTIMHLQQLLDHEVLKMSL